MILQETGLKDQFEYKALRLPLWGRAAETARGVPRGSAHWRGRGAAPNAGSRGSAPETSELPSSENQVQNQKQSKNRKFNPPERMGNRPSGSASERILTALRATISREVHCRKLRKALERMEIRPSGFKNPNFCARVRTAPF